MSHAIVGLISSLFFFAVAAILMTPVLRNMVIARPAAIFFAAEGLCTLLGGILLWIHETTAVVVNWIRVIVMTAAAAYVFYSLYVVYRLGKNSAVPTPEQHQARPGSKTE